MTPPPPLGSPRPCLSLVSALLSPRAAFAVLSASLLLVFIRRRSHASLLDSTVPGEWEYIAEGALNITVRYMGSDSRLIGRVLRLRKFASKQHESQWKSTSQFVEAIMVPLLTRRFVPRSHLVRLTAQFVRQLATRIESRRPLSRRLEGRLDDQAQVGSLMYDHARLACRCGKGCVSLCFEIKPKWGFLPKASKWPCKLRVDRFTMHQAWKQHQKQQQAPTPAAALSKYAPLELYSRDPARVRHALECLVATPQNNLRLFEDGVQAFPAQPGGAEAEPRELGQVLARSGRDVSELVGVLAGILCRETVLERVRLAQNVGGEWDIEVAWEAYVQMQQRRQALGELHVGGLPTGPALSPKEVVRRFLISATARDCSIMVALSQCPQARGLGQAGEWVYDIAVCDLDAKPVSKMQHYHEVDTAICEFFSRLGGQ